MTGSAVWFYVTMKMAMMTFSFLLLSWSWSLRYIHFALDTVVLYGVLRERNMDERGHDDITGSDPGGSDLPSGRRVPGEGMARGSRRSNHNHTSKLVSFTPPV